jgi:hypothetical protein
MQSARQAANSRWVEVAGRAGLAAKGVVYLIVGLLAVQIPLGLGGEAPDREGALQAVAQERHGKITLIALAVGLACYALWRLVQAAFDRDGEGDDAKGLAKRAGQLGKALFYGASSFVAVTIAVGLRRGESNEQRETAEILGLPAGRWLVAILGLAFLGAGLFNAYRSLTGSFRDHLREHQLGEAARGWVLVVGVVGHAARGVVFALIGLFLSKAALEYDAREAIGLDGALRKLAEQPYGGVLLGTVAAGVLAYALYCFVQVRYRDV